MIISREFRETIRIVAIPEMRVLKGYTDCYGSLLPQSQYVV